MSGMGVESGPKRLRRNPLTRGVVGPPGPPPSFVSEPTFTSFALDSELGSRCGDVPIPMESEGRTTKDSDKPVVKRKLFELKLLQSHLG